MAPSGGGGPEHHIPGANVAPGDVLEWEKDNPTPPSQKPQKDQKRHKQGPRTALQ